MDMGLTEPAASSASGENRRSGAGNRSLYCLTFPTIPLVIDKMVFELQHHTKLSTTR